MDCTAPDSRLDQVLALAAAGNENAWRSLVARYSAKVFALIFRHCRDRELAEEVTQATFVKVVSSIGRYKELGRFESWLFRIAMNQLRDEMRGRKRRAVSASGLIDGSEVTESWLEAQASISQDPSNHDPFHLVSRGEQVELLREAVGRLSETDQQVLYLRHTAGLSFAQIAESLNQPLGTVLARGHRALGKLRKLVQQQDSGPPPHPTGGT